MSEQKKVRFNFGPQHPAAHGVLRLLIDAEGEVVTKIDTQVGLLHRATEKLCESKPFNHNIGYMDRLDYVSMLCNEHAYVRAIEGLLQLDVPERAQYIRVLFDELTRIMNHLMVTASMALDIGAMTPWFYAFREREVLMDCYEAASGARMHANYYRPGGVDADLPDQMPKFAHSQWRDPAEVDKRNADRQGSLLDYIQAFLMRFPGTLDEIETLLTDNRVWKQRNVGIGVVEADRAIALGFTGPMLRSTGIAWDLRKSQAYAVYDRLDFQVAVGGQGDCYDRYLVRMAEMRQSVVIAKQCVAWLQSNPGIVMSSDPKVALPKREVMKHDMESMIHHYKLVTEGYHVPPGEVYACVEHPKGEFGVTMVSDGANKPYRVKIRPAGFPHLAALDELCRGHMISDVVAILGSMDIVFGEIDR